MKHKQLGAQAEEPFLYLDFGTSLLYIKYKLHHKLSLSASVDKNI